ncbi:hypothetical protein [Halobacteriovorax sp. HLS]|uniref:hypothetical protein n=1 Tax=Halobacteriovorax sp. HLS TaxID=2234000 RepID=UPI000FDA0207|nr:hypothetical protein [Halobacteriovorax sp. HLS]
MDSRLRVEGIYDKRTVQRLKQSGLKDLSFDFRVRSFNFLQKHIFEELLDEVSHDDQIYLLFENEADFVIESIIEVAQTKCKKENIILEFSDDQSASFYESFGMSYIWHYQSDSKNMANISSSNLLKGINLSFTDLLDAHNKVTLHNLSVNLHATFSKLFLDESGLLILNLDWDSNLFSSIVEYFDFDIISMAINNKVEVCYRNVDLSKMQDHVRYLQELSL